MHCPSCKQSIDDDSLHCDQCGAELMQCPRCGHLGKGKRCPADGTALVSRKAGASAPSAVDAVNAAAVSAATPPAPTSASASPAVPGTVSPAATVTATSSSGALPTRLRLRAASQGIDLTPASGAVLGRRLGPHADVLSRFAQISSQHVELRQDAAGAWFVKDLDSYNHSFIDGRRIAPGVEHPLSAGSVLSLGDVALQVVLE